MSKLLTWPYQLWEVGLEGGGRDSCLRHLTTSGPHLLSCKFRACSWATSQRSEAGIWGFLECLEMWTLKVNISKSLFLSHPENLESIEVHYRANTVKTLILFACEITCRNFGDSRVFGKNGAACGWQVILIVLDLEGWLERVRSRVGIGGLPCWYNAINKTFRLF